MRTIDVNAAAAAIRGGATGPQVGAFFDLDGTLVRGYTAGSVYRDHLRSGEARPSEIVRTFLAALDGLVLGGDPRSFAEVAMELLEGHTVEEVERTGERLFTERIAGTIRPEARDLVRVHLRMGHTVVVASSATRMQILPVARDLGIPHVVCTELEAEDGVLTGRSTTGLLWGEPKSKAVRVFAEAHGIDLENSYGYANGPEDIAFLGTVGRPYAVNPHPALRRATEEAGWPVLTLREPSSAGLRACLGTAGAVLAVNAGLTTGVACGWLTGDRRLGRNAGIELAAATALAVAGVKLNVAGAENLEKVRPAVFIANHQSTLDAVVLAALLRHDFTAVAKKEARLDPRMLLAGAVLDPVWIDRSDPATARATLNGVTDRLRDGQSIVVLPEGTRMPTPRLGRFKKGAFHMARRAAVPLVPIVLRNAGELARRRSLFVSPGTVDVAVLDPIPTAGWTAGGLDERIADVRRRFADTLENWPA
jgi:putative phosphoserine phosphatase/1-acylglycerol-3-phosphate O-acyltransferase